MTYKDALKLFQDNGWTLHKVLNDEGIVYRKDNHLRAMVIYSQSDVGWFDLFDLPAS